MKASKIIFRISARTRTGLVPGQYKDSWRGNEIRGARGSDAHRIGLYVRVPRYRPESCSLESAIGRPTYLGESLQYCKKSSMCSHRLRDGDWG